MRDRTLLLAFVACLCAGFAGGNAGAAEIYKWVDQYGHVQFGDRPPEQGAEKMDVHTTAPAQDPAMDQQREKRDKLLEMYQEERSEHDRKENEAREQKQKREANCKSAREQLNQMRTAQFLYEKTADPRNPRVLNDKERAARTANMEQQVAKWCQ